MRNISHSIELVRPNTSLTCYLGIFSASLEVLLTERQSFLNATEQNEFTQLRHSKRQHSYLLGRKCAKDLLQQYFGLDPKFSTIGNGIFGQPILQSTALNSYAISISHSEDTAAVLLYPNIHPMGIDIENTVAANQDVIKQYVTASELNLIQEYDTLQHLPLMIWSAREAAAKLLQCGMGVPKQVLAVKELSIEQSRVTFNFENFFHIKACCIVRDQLSIAIALPSNTTLGSF